MDKRALLAVALSCLIYIGWLILFAPRPPAVNPPSQASTAPSAAETTEGGAGKDPAASGAAGAESSRTGSHEAGGGDERTAVAPRREAAEDAPPAVIDTDVARIEIRQPGARIASWRLKRYLDHHDRPYEMISQDAPAATVFPLGFELEDKSLQGLLNGKARFDVERRAVADAAEAGAGPGAVEPEAGTRPVETRTEGSKNAEVETRATSGASSAGASSSKGPFEEVRFVYSDGRGLEAVKTLVFDKSSYLVRVTASVRKDGAIVPSTLVWGPGIGTPDAEDLANRYYHGGTVVADFGVGPQRFYASKVSTRTSFEQPLRWIGIEEQYFAAVFLSTADPIPGAQIEPVISQPSPEAAASASNAGKKLLTHLAVAVPSTGTYSLFVGPKDYQLLKGLNRGLADLVNFTPGIPVIGPLVGVLAKVLYATLRWLHAYIGNYGLAIILLTTAIKIAFYPITQRAMVKMRAVQQQMQKIQPKIKAIQERYKRSKDAAGRAKMNEEIMAVYRREGINPMASLGGCLPLVLQLPILYGFYSVLTVSIELRQAPFFGWIQDLSRRDPYYITPILMGLTMFLQQRMAMTKVTDPQARMQQRMMLIMPLIFTWTFLSLPSGLVLYWFVNNILGIVQQVLINRQAKAMETAGAAATGKA